MVKNCDPDKMTELMEKEDDYVGVSPDGDMFILSATKKDVILKVNLNFEEDNVCILYVDRKLFRKAFDGWLDRKAEYNRSYNGEFCGQGSIYFEGLVELPAGAYLSRFMLEDTNDWDEDSDKWGERVDVKSYRATSFCVDMEHG